MSESDPSMNVAESQATEVDTSTFGDQAMRQPVASGHEAAEGTGTNAEMQDLGSANRIKQMMFSTGPDQPLEQVENPWNPEKGGITRVWRGLGKMADVDGMWAIGDVVIGMAEAAYSYQLEGGTPQNNETQGESAPDRDVEDPITAAAVSDDDE